MANATTAFGGMMKLDTTKAETIGDLSKRINTQFGPFLKAFNLLHEREPLSHKWTVGTCEIEQDDVIALEFY